MERRGEGEEVISGMGPLILTQADPEGTAREALCVASRSIRGGGMPVIATTVTAADAAPTLATVVAKKVTFQVSGPQPEKKGGKARSPPL